MCPGRPSTSGDEQGAALLLLFVIFLPGEAVGRRGGEGAARAAALGPAWREEGRRAAAGRRKNRISIYISTTRLQSPDGSRGLLCSAQGAG